MKVLVLVNTLTSVNSNVYANHIAFWGQLKKDYPDDDFLLYTPERSSIDRARNVAAKYAMNLGCDYLLFIDDDVLVHPSGFKKLFEAQQDIIAGLVIIRGYPFNVMAFKETENTDERGKLVKGLDFYNDLPLDEGGDLISQVLSCGAVGFSFCLIRVSMLLTLPPPFFVTGTFNTEDIYFCEKYKLQCLNDNVPPLIALHTGVRCGHILPGEAVEWGTREKFKEFYKPVVEERDRFNTRDLQYIEGAVEAL